MYLNENLLMSLRTGKTDPFFINSKYKEYISEESLGTINLTTGKIVANDPLCLFETQSFERAVSPGNYPVMLYVLHIDTDQRVAFSEIRFTDELPIHFEPALLDGQDMQALNNDEFFGYGVDSGTGSFMDKETCNELLKILESTDDGILPDLDKALEESYVYTYSTANVYLPESTNNIVAFSSGYGDGAYPSFWGLNNNNEICCLITDFCIIDS